MKCVSSVMYSVLINDQPHGMITPQRGLRQGDPLSPFLFVLCTEGLVHLMSRAEREGRIMGMRFGDHGPSINHLLFADDSLFSCKANEVESLELLSVLNSYGKATGQVINHAKSSIIFGKMVKKEVKIKIKECLGIEKEGGEAKYLGLPEVLKGSKVKHFSYIKERLCKKISGWHARTLSQGGKEVLIKAVASALPVAAMSVFKFPKTLIASLHSAMATFWWSSDEHKRKIHWLSWDKLCLPKEQGGMGFRDLECFNQALLAKQAWRIIDDDDCLMSRVMCGKYFENNNFINACLGRRPSYAWRSIIFGRNLLKQGMKHLVGNGQTINVWSEPWLEDVNGLCRPPLGRQRLFNVNLKVADVINHQTGRWDERIMEEIFVPGDIAILRRNQPMSLEKDSWVWRHTRSGLYSVKTGYDLAFQNLHKVLIGEQSVCPSINPLKEDVWKLLTSSKIKGFIWKAISGAIAVFDHLQDRGLKSDIVCQTCGADGESVNHVLFQCTFAKQVWALSGFPIPRGGFDDGSLFANINYLLVNWKKRKELLQVTKKISWMLWYLWKNRNALLFEGALFPSDQICSKASEEAELWYAAQDMDGRCFGAHREPTFIEAAVWKAPPRDVLKCNVGVVWGKKKNMAGAVWVLRDSRGDVLLHSRRSFAQVDSKDHAQYLGLVWAVESMVSHRCLRVHFSFEGWCFVNAINRPKAWPSFRSKVVEIRNILRNVLVWRVENESFAANREARNIAITALKDVWFQSYVARGFPRWCS